MSSFRNHRVVIASLFLPATAVLSDVESSLPTPAHPQKVATLAIPTSAFRPGDKPKATVTRPQAVGGHSHSSSVTTNGQPSGPFKGIVEDLKDKVGFTSLLCAISSNTHAV